VGIEWSLAYGGIITLAVLPLLKKAAITPERKQP